MSRADGTSRNGAWLTPSAWAATPTRSGAWSGRCLVHCMAQPGCRSGRCVWLSSVRVCIEVHLGVVILAAKYQCDAYVVCGVLQPLFGVHVHIRHALHICTCTRSNDAAHYTPTALHIAGLGTWRTASMGETTASRWHGSSWQCVCGASAPAVAAAAAAKAARGSGEGSGE